MKVGLAPAFFNTKCVQDCVRLTGTQRELASRPTSSRPLTADMGIWTEADTNLDGGGHEISTLAATKSGRARRTVA